MKIRRRIHWSDESRYLQHVNGDGYEFGGTYYSLYTQGYNDNSAIRRRLRNGFGCIFHDCKLDLIEIQGNLDSQGYIDDVQESALVPHFDNHPTRLIFMDDNVRPHLSRAIRLYAQNNTIGTLSWPAINPDSNPFEHNII